MLRPPRAFGTAVAWTSFFTGGFATAFVGAFVPTEVDTTGTDEDEEDAEVKEAEADSNLFWLMMGAGYASIARSCFRLWMRTKIVASDGYQDLDPSDV